MVGRKIVLEFDQVTIPASSHHDEAVAEVSLQLSSGEWALIRTEDDTEHLPLADAAEGLIAPSQGTIRFLGEDWVTMTPQRESVLRGRIRRIFHTEGWISNLTMIENILLAEMHHTGRPAQELMEEAAQLALSFGVSVIPDGRPATVPSQVLRKMEWVRALMGKPELILIDRKLLGVSREDAGRLIHALSRRIEQGTAILWITGEAAICDHEGLNQPYVSQYGMRGMDMILEKRAEL